MPLLRTFALCSVCCLFPTQIFFPFARAQSIPNLPPIAPSERSPQTTGPGTAVVLFYAVDTDNPKSTETHSIRIKILNDEGKKYADVEIPVIDKYSQVDEIYSRVVAPDGTVTPFAGEIYDRDIVKLRKLRYHAKVFAIPNVQTGSIIEYTYRLHFKNQVPYAFQHPENLSDLDTYPAANWVIQRDLAVKHARFTLTPLKNAYVHDFSVGLGNHPVIQYLPDGRVQLDLLNIPAYEPEEFAPPEDSLKIRVNLYYAHPRSGPAGYWLSLSSAWSDEYKQYIGHSKLVAVEAARLCPSSDSRDANLRKIYARVQQIRQIDNADEKTSQELRRENLKENHNIEDVLKHGYGSGRDINLLFVGLARAADLQAYPVRLTSRRSAVFTEEFPDYQQLDSFLVAVSVDDGFLFLSPGSMYCPYGLLPWDEMNSGGILVDYVSGRVLYTPLASTTDAITRTSGDLQLTAEGNLTGRISIAYEGQDALLKREWAFDRDEIERREALEEALKIALPQSATVTLLSVMGWEQTGAPLTTNFQIDIPGYATSAGGRLILPLGVLHTRASNPFVRPRRIHPVAFDYPYETYEDICIILPPDSQLESLPPAQKFNNGAALYALSAALDGNTLEIKRTRRVSIVSVDLEKFHILRKHYADILAGDALQVTLKKTAPQATK